MCLGQCLNCGEYGECNCGESAPVHRRCSSSADIAFAMRVLAGNISSPDYVPNTACIEAADRIDALTEAVGRLHDLLHRANSTFVPSNDLACQKIAKALRETEWLVEHIDHTNVSQKED